MIKIQKFKLSIPIPPSVNHCYWYRAGKRIKTKQANEYCDSIAEITRNLMTMYHFKTFREHEKIRCDMTFYFPDARNRDTHNTFKLLFDAIEDGGLYVNDRYVLPNVKDFCIDRGNPRLELEFYYEGDAA